MGVVRVVRFAIAPVLMLAPFAPASADQPAPTGGDGDLICSTYDTTETTCTWVADFKAFSTPSDFVGEIAVYDETDQRYILRKQSPERGLHTYNFIGGRIEVGLRYTATLTGEGWFSIVEGYPPAV